MEVPAQPNQEVFQTLVDLAIEERSGGYGDRSGKKNERCDKVKLSTTVSVSTLLCNMVNVSTSLYEGGVSTSFCEGECIDDVV